MKKILLLLGLSISLFSYSQVSESFADGNFIAPPQTWAGDQLSFSVFPNSLRGPNSTGSQTLRLQAPVSTTAANYSLGISNSSWGTFQAWAFWWGRGTVVNANNFQYFWLFSDRLDVNNPAVNGYRLVMTASAGAEELRIERVNAGVGTTIVTTSSGIPQGTTDFAFRVRVTRSASNVWTIYTAAALSTLTPGGIDPATSNPIGISFVEGSSTDPAPISLTGTGYFVLQCFVAANAGAGPRSSTEFDQFSFEPNGTLPVTLISFKAIKDGNKARLDWKVGTEVNVDGYEIEKSNNGVNFTKIGFVPAKGVPTYNFSDEQVSTSTNFYRLRTVDIDKSYAYSHIVSVNGTKGSYIRIFPNPANDRLYIQHTDASVKAQLRVISMEGRVMKNMRIAENTVQTILDIQSLPAGIYHLVYEYGTGEQLISKFVKQ